MKNWNYNYRVDEMFWQGPADKGDLNENSFLAVADLVLCWRMSLRLNEPNHALADMNGNEVVNILDLILLLRKILDLA
ncbi:MAG: hypothetical protein NC911_01150 [Candidatus Omnitrophica bacterium]|nr:hypothetical protein [Candidatus Omnitrophota bacterium]